MKQVEPSVRLIARPDIDWSELLRYLDSIGADDEWWGRRHGDADAQAGEVLVEAAGRVCYKSWNPGLNPNVTKVREDRAEYLRNILSSAHGSVLEHANYSFVFSDVSRVLTAELNRHRAGAAISEQSLRYVRFEDIPFWLPDWAKSDQVLLDAIRSHLHREEEFQAWLTQYFDFHKPGMPFREKKKKTSFMRRFLPMGIATEEFWTANVRTLRYVIEKRTDPAAEEEIRIAFGHLARTMIEEAPLLFGDFREMPDGTFVPKYSKV